MSIGLLRRARGVRVALVAPVLVLAACTGGALPGTGALPGSGSGSHGTAGRTGSSSSSSPSPAAPVTPRLTALARAWSWHPMGTVGNPILHRLVAAAQDGTRAYALAQDEKSVSNPDLDHAEVYAADLATGRAAWSASVVGDPVRLLVAGGVVAVQLDRAHKSEPSMIGYDAATGRRLWQRTDTRSESGDPQGVVLDGAFYVAHVSGTATSVARLNARTGTIAAQVAVSELYGLTAGDGRLLATGYDGVSAFGPQLGTAQWHVHLADTAQDEDFVVGQALIRKVSTYGKSLPLVALSTRTGRRLWSAKLALNPYDTDVSVAGSTLLLHLRTTMTALDGASGRQVWRQSDKVVDLAAAAADVPGNLLGCGTAVLSGETSTSALYSLVTLPSEGFGADGCVVAPVPTAGALPHGALVATPVSVFAYTGTVADAPDPQPDKLGRWGSADPATCRVDATATHAALVAGFGGAWTLTEAGLDGHCEWTRRPGPLDVQTFAFASQTQARLYLDPHNNAGGCVRLSKHQVLRTIAVPGLAGAAACYSSGDTSFGAKQDDSAAGIARTRAGRWFGVFVTGYPFGGFVAAKGPAHVVALVRALAR